MSPGMMKSIAMQQALNLDILYSFIIILCSLMIYFGTKELYDLSSHRGIKYFRLAFLFFAIAYFFRSFIKFILIYFNIPEIMQLSPKAFGTLTIMAFMYFSIMAIFYLLYSVIWKKINSNKIYIFHITAILMTFVSIFSHSQLIYLLINLLILIIAITTVLIAHKKKRKQNYTYLAYILLSFFWALNILDILIPDFFRNTQLIIYLVSSGIFFIILYRVLRNTGAN